MSAEPGPCGTILENHQALSRRRERSQRELDRARTEFAACQYLQDLPLSVFCAGSLARAEIGEKSDLDIFVIADSSDRLQSRLCEYTLFAHLIRINNDVLGFPPFSNDGEYLKINFIEDLKARTGSRRDDIENLFTARMLLMLESKPLIHSELYNKHLRAILEHYYRDQKGKVSFKPLFLLNDILRYWRTLCLNYEERRHEPDRPWRKKNVSLKFSRMLTVFSTVLPLIAKPLDTLSDLEVLCQKTPLERLSFGLDILSDRDLTNRWTALLDIYEAFLGWKDDDNVEKYLEGGEQKATVRRYAGELSTFLFNALTHDRIPFEFRRYLIL